MHCDPAAIALDRVVAACLDASRWLTVPLDYVPAGPRQHVGITFGEEEERRRFSPIYRAPAKASRYLNE